LLKKKVTPISTKFSLLITNIIKAGIPNLANVNVKEAEVHRAQLNVRATSELIPFTHMAIWAFSTTCGTTSRVASHHSPLNWNLGI